MKYNTIWLGGLQYTIQKIDIFDWVYYGFLHFFTPFLTIIWSKNLSF